MGSQFNCGLNFWGWTRNSHCGANIPVTADHEIVQQVRKIADNQGAGLTKTELELSKKDMTNSFTQEKDLKYENQIISEIENVNSLTGFTESKNCGV